MTYRLDADIYAPFGHFDRIANASDKVAAGTKNFAARTKNFAAGKTKMAAWFVSNCFDKSQRMQWVIVLNFLYVSNQFIVTFIIS